jgi:hypothetical protein
MANHSYVVKVQRPHAKRFEPDRPITDLVRNQLMHLSLAQRHLDKKHHHPVDVYSIKTDAEAAEFIRHVTARLHARKGKATNPTPKAKLPKVKPRESKPAKKSSRPKRKRKGRS